MIRPTKGATENPRRIIGQSREDSSFTQLLTDSAVHRIQNRASLTIGIKELLGSYEKNLLGGYDSGDVKIVGMLEVGFGLIRGERIPMEVFLL